MNKLSSAFQFFKNHYGKIFSGITGTIIFTLAGYWFSDLRYAHAVDVKKQNQEILQAIDGIKKEIKEISKQK